MVQLSTSYETHLKQLEGNAPKPSNRIQHLLEQRSPVRMITQGIRDGIQQAGMSSTSIHLIEDSSVDHGNGTITAGVFNRMNGRIGLAGVKYLAETIDLSVSNIRGHVRKRIKNILHHEKRHKVSCDNAKKRGEFGLIATHLGAEADRLLQELMASYGTTDEFDAYDADRAKATALVAQLGLTVSEVVQMLLEGREADIVLAAFASGYLQSQHAHLN